MSIITATAAAVKTKTPRTPQADCDCDTYFEVKHLLGVEYPAVLDTRPTPDGGYVQLLEWPSMTETRGRYVVRRYAAGQLTERVTTDSLGDARALVWHLSTPLPADPEPTAEAADWAMPGESDLDHFLDHLMPVEPELSDDHNGAFGMLGCE